MSFKIKNRKKKTVDKRTTIDAKHKNIVKQFKDENRNFRKRYSRFRIFR